MKLSANVFVLALFCQTILVPALESNDTESPVFSPRQAVTDCLELSPQGDCADPTYGPIEDWDVSHVLDMNGLFEQHASFDADISKWNVARVRNMDLMFAGATSFNGDLSKWDVSHVTSMRMMFNQATSFNGDIADWDVSRVTAMSSMFFLAKAFRTDLSKWNVLRVTNMEFMFGGVKAVNPGIAKWEMSDAVKWNLLSAEPGEIVREIDEPCIPNHAPATPPSPVASRASPTTSMATVILTVPSIMFMTLGGY